LPRRLGLFTAVAAVLRLNASTSEVGIGAGGGDWPIDGGRIEVDGRFMEFALFGLGASCYWSGGKRDLGA
jgi:hypothetical protein